MAGQSPGTSSDVSARDCQIIRETLTNRWPFGGSRSAAMKVSGDKRERVHGERGDVRVGNADAQGHTALITGKLMTRYRKKGRRWELIELWTISATKILIRGLSCGCAGIAKV